MDYTIDQQVQVDIHLRETIQWEIASEECDQGLAEGRALHNSSAVTRMLELKREVVNRIAIYEKWE